MDKRDLNLLGKDYFTVDEAAHYACVSSSQFREHATKKGIFPFPWMGKHVYRKVDVQRVMEEEAWQHYDGGGSRMSLTGATRKGSTEKASARFRKGKRSLSSKQKNT